MARGTVKWFDPKKGFGFVVNEQGIDVFVHYTSIEGDGFRCLKSGQEVDFQEKGSAKGLQGLQVRVVSEDSEVTASDDRQESEPSSV
jgi:CspA family cold shock protein